MKAQHCINLARSVLHLHLAINHVPLSLSFPSFLNLYMLGFLKDTVYKIQAEQWTEYKEYQRENAQILVVEEWHNRTLLVHSLPCSFVL